MIQPGLYEVARQRQRDLLAAAERHRLGRRARDRKTHRSAVSLPADVPALPKSPLTELEPSTPASP